MNEVLQIIEEKFLIPGDHPDALRLLQEQLTKRLELRKLMKVSPMLIKKRDRDAFLLHRLASPELWDRLVNADGYGRVGFKAHQISRNSLAIRSIRSQINTLWREASRSADVFRLGLFSIAHLAAIGKLEVSVPAGLDRPTRRELNKLGLRYDRSRRIWEADYREAKVLRIRSYLQRLHQENAHWQKNQIGENDIGD